jgi:hypothetical protein
VKRPRRQTFSLIRYSLSAGVIAIGFIDDFSPQPTAADSLLRRYGPTRTVTSRVRLASEADHPTERLGCNPPFSAKKHQQAGLTLRIGTE